MRPVLCLLRLHAWGFWFRVGHLGNQVFERRVCKRLPRCRATEVRMRERKRGQDKS